VTCTAALTVSLPAWSAVRVQVPGVSMVAVAVDAVTVHTVGVVEAHTYRVMSFIISFWRGRSECENK